MKATVIGGGIGGLAAALALEQAGAEVTVYERADQIRDGGTALVLWPNAVKALQRLGVAEQVLQSATNETRSEIRDWRGALLNSFSMDEVMARFGAPAIFVRRTDLQEVLRGALRSSSLHLGKACRHVETDDASAMAHFADGTSVVADLLIGADGFHSVARRLFDPRPPRYAGFTAWRGLVEGAGSLLEAGVGFEAWGVGSRFGAFRTSRGDLFWFATMTAPPGGGDSAQGRKADVMARFAGWAEPVPTLVAATPPEAILRHDQYDRLPLGRMTTGRVALLGDAAHPMTPQLGQGACQALEDAVALGRRLKAAPGPEALIAYEEDRLARTRRIASTAWRLGRVQQMSSPTMARLRNQAIRALPGSFLLGRLSWIIGYEP